MSELPSTPQGSPTSWRDVYQLVQDSERRLTATITDGFRRTAAKADDHEVRLRVAEASIAGFHTLVEQSTVQQKAVLDDWGAWRRNITTDVEAIQKSDLMAEARMGGILAVGTKAKAALLIGVSIVSPLITTFLLRAILPPQ